MVANSSDDRIAKLQSDPNAGDLVLADLVLAGRMNGLGLLGSIDLKSVPNYKFVNPAFKIGLASPQARKLIPTDFGRSGILYRKDLFRIRPRHGRRSSPWRRSTRAR